MYYIYVYAQYKYIFTIYIYIYNIYVNYIYIYTHIIFTYKYTGLSSKPGQIATRIIPNLGNPEILSPVFDAFEAFILFLGIVFTVSKKKPMCWAAQFTSPFLVDHMDPQISGCPPRKVVVTWSSCNRTWQPPQRAAGLRLVVAGCDFVCPFPWG